MKLTSLVGSLWFLSGAWVLGAESLSQVAPTSQPVASVQPVAAPFPVFGPGTWGGDMASGMYGGSAYSGGTVGGSVMTGMSNLVRAEGQANLLNSAAANNWEAARLKNMQNNWVAAEGYFQGRAMNKKYREELGLIGEKSRASQEDMVRFAKAGVPKQLSPSDLDPLTGAIAWPEILQEAIYQTDRKTLDQLYADRAKSGTLSRDQRSEVARAAQALQDTLKANINSYGPQEYIAAKRFLEQLAYEIRRQPT